VNVAAFQSEYIGPGRTENVIASIRAEVVRCEEESIDILCCPEACLGGLADDAERPHEIAINAANGGLERILSPLASKTVAVIVGFTEIADNAALYNSAAVYFDGVVIGIYRKMRPAINRSVYTPGTTLPVFHFRGLTFGIQICNDSNFPEQTADLAAKGATVLFVPSNNALPAPKADVLNVTRDADVALAVENSIYIVRADVAGSHDGFVAYGTSKCVDPTGRIVAEAPRLKPSLIHTMITMPTAFSAANVV
jgi:predicted amidohydrolase